MSPDTDPKVAAFQIALLRQASTAQRFGRARSLSQSTIALSRRAIRRANPGVDEMELLITFVALHYGHELANRLRGFLDGRR